MPNFLIVGAPKCGTTSLYYYLKQHPEIFMSPVKEPRFFTSQVIAFPQKGIKDYENEKYMIKRWEDYKKLFSCIKGEKAIGEASVDNLYFHEGVIPIIKDRLGDPKIIIILRDPADRAYSHYLQTVRDVREKLTFEEGLEAEEERRRNNWDFGWYYQAVGYYYDQVRAYLENFSKVKILLMDDLKDDNNAAVEGLFEFLEVDKGFTPDMRFNHNASGVPKKNVFSRTMNYAMIRTRAYYLWVSKYFVLRGGSGPGAGRARMVEYLESVKNKNLEKPEMDPATRKKLVENYFDDINKLEGLINRDLAAWKE